MKTTIEFISELPEQEVRQLLLDICERLPISNEDFSQLSLPDKITHYVNEANRLSKLEEATTDYIVHECNKGNIGVQDPINFLIASHRMLRYHLHNS